MNCILQKDPKQALHLVHIVSAGVIIPFWLDRITSNPPLWPPTPIPSAVEAQNVPKMPGNSQWVHCHSHLWSLINSFIASCPCPPPWAGCPSFHAGQPPSIPSYHVWESQDPFGSLRMTFHPVTLYLRFSSLFALWQSTESGVGSRVKKVKVGHWFWGMGLILFDNTKIRRLWVKGSFEKENPLFIFSLAFFSPLQNPLMNGYKARIIRLN